jgi:hypothetical protein
MGTDMDEQQPYEAVAEVAKTFPARVSGEFLASTIARLLPRKYRKDIDFGLQLYAKIGQITTPEQFQTRIAALLISVTPRHNLRAVEKAVLRTQPELNGWDAYRNLALRCAEFGAWRRALKLVMRIQLPMGATTP